MSRREPEIIALNRLTAGSSDSSGSNSTASSGSAIGHADDESLTPASSVTSLETPPHESPLPAGNDDHERAFPSNEGSVSPQRAATLDQHDADVDPDQESAGRRSSEASSTWTSTISQLSGVNSIARLCVASGKKLTALLWAHAIYIVIYSVITLIFLSIQTFTGSVPSSVDIATLNATQEFVKMQKLLLPQAIKTANQSLAEQRIGAEAQNAQLKDLIQIQNQTLELQKWENLHEYIKTCTAFAVIHVSSLFGEDKFPLGEAYLRMPFFVYRVKM